MPSMSMASRILRATLLEAARAARSAASAASRCAAAAEAAAAARSGSGGGASAASSADPLPRSSSVVAAPAARGPASSGSVRSLVVVAARTPPPRNSPDHGSGSTIPTRPRLPPPSPFLKPEGWVPFEAEEKDLESDEALWALYERWCKHFNEARDPDEMVRRFSYFKDTVLRVEENKRSDLPYRLGINQFADGELRELLPSGGVTRPHSASPIYGSEFLFNEEEGPNKEPAGQAAGAASARACSVQWLLHSALATLLHSRPVSNPSSA